MDNTKDRGVLIEALVASGLIAIGFATGQAPLLALATAATSIGTGWAANLAGYGFQHWRENWFTEQGVLNQDIMRALSHAFENAVCQVERDWKHQRRYQYLRLTDPEGAQRTLIPLVWLREDAEKIFQKSERLASVLQEDKFIMLLHNDVTNIRDSVIKALDNYLYGHDSELIAFVEERLANEWLLHFAEILKDPGTEGTRAWRQCQWLWQISLNTAVGKLEQSSTETLTVTRWLQKWAQQLAQTPIAERDPRGQDSLEVILSLVRTRLDELQASTERIEAHVGALLERLSSPLVPGVPIWLDTAHFNFMKTLLPSEAMLNLLQGLTTERLLPRRLFLQYINPEILSLYGTTLRFKRQELYKQVLRLTKFALLLSEDVLIMPASYLFELGFISHFLKELTPLEAAGIIQFASPSADLYEYVHTKKLEYRDELILFPEYAKDGRALISKSQSLSWIPRVQRSTAKDISTAWKQELYKGDGLWKRILEERGPKQSLLPSKLESAIELVPEHLEGRAFIFRYTEPLLPMTLEAREETQINFLICRTYLESYLEEFNAMILVDTPLGYLDCGLSQISAGGYLRTISFRSLSASFKMINLLDYIDHQLGWYELIDLRGQPLFRRLMNLFIINMLDERRPLNTAITDSHYQVPHTSPNAFGGQALEIVNNQIVQLLEIVEPFLRK